MKGYAQFTNSGGQRSIFIFLTAFSALTLLIFFSGDVAADKTAEVAATAPTCRFGTATSRDSEKPYLEDLGVGWVVDFWATPSRTMPAGIEYSPMVRLLQDQNNGTRLDSYTMRTPSIATLAASHPGALWLVGNEVDRAIAQDDMMPEIYAKAYHDIYHEIKAEDPTALVANSGLVSVSPGRLQYLDLVWDSYYQMYGTEMPVDVWNMHIYILGEKKFPTGEQQVAYIALGTDPSIALWYSNFNSSYCTNPNIICWEDHDDVDLFWNQVKAMRQWMKDRGQQNKPLILSEWSLLLPNDIADEYGQLFDQPRVVNYLNSTVELMENGTDPSIGYPADNYKLVQQWLWFHMNDGSANTPNALVNLDGNGNPTGLTQIGQAYKQQISNVDARPNLALTTVYNPVISNSTSAKLTAEIVNNGNAAVSGSFKVGFYEDPGFSNKIGEVTVPTGFEGCGQERMHVSVTWDGLSPDSEVEFWVRLDDGADVDEIDDASDNIGRGKVWVDPPFQAFMPFTKR